MRLVIASRRSDLARLQAHLVAGALRKVRPELEIEFKFKISVGDLNPDRSLMDFSKGAFTSDFVQDLLTGQCDLVVHSWKDLPIEETPGTAVVATMARADIRDLFLIPKSVVMKRPTQLRVLASSPRRAYNLTEFLPTIMPWKTNVEFTPVRGNVPTRLAKLLDGDGDGLIVAKAALDRLLMAEGEEFVEVRTQVRAAIDRCRWMVLPISQNPAAAAQGALAIEIAAKREDLRGLLKQINEPEAEANVRKEREILARYGGGCHQKIGVSVLSREANRLLSLRGLTDDGKILQSFGWMEPKLENQAKEISYIFPATEGEGQWFQRTERPLEAIKDRLEGAQALFVAKAFAWPKGFKASEQIVWAAGVKSWQTLAQAGVWVHGCADQLGEAEDPLVEALTGRKLEWTRLTHDQAANDVQAVATYSLAPLSVSPNLDGKTHFFWSSGSSFLRAKELFPEVLRKGIHACGPGKTRSLIRQHTSREPNVFLTWSEWRQSVLCAGYGNENR